MYVKVRGWNVFYLMLYLIYSFKIFRNMECRLSFPFLFRPCDIEADVVHSAMGTPTKEILGTSGFLEDFPQSWSAEYVSSNDILLIIYHI